MTYNGCHEPVFRSDLAPVRILVVALRDLLVFAVPFDVLLRSIRNALLSIRDLRLTDSLGGGVVKRGRQGRIGLSRGQGLRFRRVRVPLVPRSGDADGVCRPGTSPSRS